MKDSAIHEERSICAISICDTILSGVGDSIGKGEGAGVGVGVGLGTGDGIGVGVGVGLIGAEDVHATVNNKVEISNVSDNCLIMVFNWPYEIIELILCDGTATNQCTE